MRKLKKNVQQAVALVFLVCLVFSFSTTVSAQDFSLQAPPPQNPYQTIEETHYIDKYFEIDQDGNLKNHIYLGDQKLADIVYDTETNSEDIFYTSSDHLGSTSVVTDEAGNVVELHDYYPFGAQNYQDIVQDAKTSQLFTGQEYDEETDLQYYSARYMDNNIGRFVSLDPVSIYSIDKYLANPQELNGYAYAMNNPLIYVDPLGLYNIKTGEIEKGDTQDVIVQSINDAFGINTDWGTIADVSFYATRLEGRPLDQLVGQSLRIGTNVTVDISKQLNSLNSDRAKIASRLGSSSLLNFKTGGSWDIKSSTDEVLGSGQDKKRDYWSYIYNGELVRYDAPGNINYGYVARAAGLWGWQAQGIAAGEQIVSDISQRNTPSFSDNTGDRKYVQMGIDLYNSSKSWWQRLSW